MRVLPQKRGIAGTAANTDGVTPCCRERKSSSAVSNRTAIALRCCALTGGKNLLLR